LPRGDVDPFGAHRGGDDRSRHRHRLEDLEARPAADADGDDHRGRGREVGAEVVDEARHLHPRPPVGEDLAHRVGPDDLHPAVGVAAGEDGPDLPQEVEDPIEVWEVLLGAEEEQGAPVRRRVVRPRAEVVDVDAVRDHGGADSGEDLPRPSPVDLRGEQGAVEAAPQPHLFPADLAPVHGVVEAAPELQPLPGALPRQVELDVVLVEDEEGRFPAPAKPKVRHEGQLDGERVVARAREHAVQGPLEGSGDHLPPHVTVDVEEGASLVEALLQPAREILRHEGNLAAVLAHERGGDPGVEGRLEVADRGHLVPARERPHESFRAPLGPDPSGARRHHGEEEDAQALWDHRVASSCRRGLRVSSHLPGGHLARIGDTRWGSTPGAGLRPGRGVPARSSVPSGTRGPGAGIGAAPPPSPLE